MLITADQNAPRGLTSASFIGKATIDGKEVTRPCRLASMSWPVPNAWSEIPRPRLLADVPVSVSGSEFAPITIASTAGKVWEVTAGEKADAPADPFTALRFLWSEYQSENLRPGI